MAKTVYGFKDKGAATRAAQYFGQNPQDQKQQALYSEAVPARIRLVEIQEDMDGHGTELDDVQFPTSEVEIVRTTTNPQSLLSETSETFHAIQAAPLEPTNYPAEAHVVAITDTFNQTFLVTPTPSEVFGTMLGPILDNTGRYEITLDQGFTVNGKNWVGAYPSPTLEEIPESEAPVTCRYIKSLAKWFFFKPTGGGGKTLTVSGPALAVSCSTVSQPVFYSEFAAGESVASGLSITAISQMQNATGSDTSNAWVQFPTAFTTDDETVYWWKKENGINFPGAGGALYQTGSAGSYFIAPVAYYGKVISDGTYYYLPYYRTINGERYWYCSTTGDYIYYTAQDGVSGWAIGQTLGKFLTSSDPEIFSASTSISDLMTHEGLTYSKPAWESLTQFGVYAANADAQALFPSVPSIQFGCGRWIASDGRTLSTPFYFTHVCDGTAKQWSGSYTCQAFDYDFSGINYISENGESYYFLGDRTSQQGFYKSASAPSTSSSATFSYTPGTHPLKGTLSLTSSVEGTETWTMTLTTGAVAVYTCAEGATSMTMASISSGDYYFRTISQQGNYWVAVGVDGTVGNLIFDGATLSKEAGNDFIFDHDIDLTFDQYVQGSEKQKVWVCSPGVIS